MRRPRGHNSSTPRHRRLALLRTSGACLVCAITFRSDNKHSVARIIAQTLARALLRLAVVVDSTGVT